MAAVLELPYKILDTHDTSRCKNELYNQLVYKITVHKLRFPLSLLQTVYLFASFLIDKLENEALEREGRFV